MKQSVVVSSQGHRLLNTSYGTFQRPHLPRTPRPAYVAEHEEEIPEDELAEQEHPDCENVELADEDSSAGCVGDPASHDDDFECL